MLTSVQKEILQSLINLYRQAKCTSVKCESIADLMGRNSGTIRNQMQSLRSLGLVQGVPGPRGGYKPTIEAYQTLNIVDDPCEIHVPIYINGKVVSDISVNKIEFTSIVRPGDCEATISVLGDIKQLDLDDEIKIGPTPVNNLIVIGKIIGRDDVDNVLLIKTQTILSIPDIKAIELATTDVKTVDPEMTILEISREFIQSQFNTAPVMENGKIVGIIRATNIIKAIAEEKYNAKAHEFMNTNILTSKDTIGITTAMDLLQVNKVPSLILLTPEGDIAGLLTFTDILQTFVSFLN